MVSVVCKQCNKWFESQRRSRQTCSVQCRNAWSRRKRGVPERSGQIVDGKKQCASCHQLLPVDSYYKYYSGPRTNRYSSYCKKCTLRQNKIRNREALGLPENAVLKVGPREAAEGSTYVSNKGYVLRKQRDHLRANKDGWVPEHIVVAEQKYGITITNEYTVHHRNGDRADNRPSNLELRVGNHGKGGDILPVLLHQEELRNEAAQLLRQYGYTVSEPS